MLFGHAYPRVLSCVLTDSPSDDGTYTLTWDAGLQQWTVTLGDGSVLLITYNDVLSFVLLFTFVTSGSTIETTSYPGGGVMWTGDVPKSFTPLDPDGETVIVSST